MATLDLRLFLQILLLFESLLKCFVALLHLPQIFLLFQIGVGLFLLELLQTSLESFLFLLVLFAGNLPFKVSVSAGTVAALPLRFLPRPATSIVDSSDPKAPVASENPSLSRPGP